MPKVSCQYWLLDGITTMSCSAISAAIAAGVLPRGDERMPGCAPSSRWMIVPCGLSAPGGGRGEGELGSCVDQVDVQHREQGVDALLGAQPAGVQDPGLAAPAGPDAAATAKHGSANGYTTLIVATSTSRKSRPQRGGVPAGGDQGPVPGPVDRERPLSRSRMGGGMCRIRYAGCLVAHQVGLVDEHDGAVERGRPRPASRSERNGMSANSSRPSAVPRPTVTTCAGDATPVQLPDLTDRVVLGATGAGG